MADEGEQKGSFWTTLPGVLTAVAALITALVGLYQVIPHNTQPAAGSSSASTSSTPAHPQGSTRSQAPPPEKFRVVEAILRADPFNYNGPCPVKIKFAGRISTAGGRGNVAYKFVRSDMSAGSPIQNLHYEQPGSQEVQTTWELAGHVSGWEQIQIVDPVEMQSDRASFSINCH